jgi:hypothetical protein
MAEIDPSDRDLATKLGVFTAKKVEREKNGKTVTQDDWKCQCGTMIQINTGSGYTNIGNHIKKKHAEWKVLYVSTLNSSNQTSKVSRQQKP